MVTWGAMKYRTSSPGWLSLRTLWTSFHYNSCFFCRAQKVVMKETSCILFPGRHPDQQYPWLREVINLCCLVRRRFPLFIQYQEYGAINTSPNVPYQFQLSGSWMVTRRGCCDRTAGTGTGVVSWSDDKPVKVWALPTESVVDAGHILCTRWLCARRSCLC